MSFLRLLSKRTTCVAPPRILGAFQFQRGYANMNPQSFPEAKLKLIPTSGEYPKGFKVTGLHCGVKKDASRKDLALIYSEVPCNAAAVFTQNIFKAAPVVVSKEILDKTGGENVNVLVANSGCANAVTGARGLDNARLMSSTAAEVVGAETGSLVMSTGVIGHHLPMKQILEGINSAQDTLGDSHEAWLNTSIAFMTTDTFPKLRSGSFKLPSGVTYRMAGLSKGAGMIHPNMATLLGMVATDAPINAACLKSALKYAADRSFNAISIDGDTSTNDTIAVLANGASTQDKAHFIQDENSEDFKQFRQDLTDFTAELAKLVVRDGEGATKFVTISVENAHTFEDAKQVANTIVTSALVKTALYGQDANWGRILCAVGYSGIENVDPTKVNLTFVPSDGSDPLELLKGGEPVGFSEQRALEVLKHEDIYVKLDLGVGNECAKMYTCDFSHEYVSINADYRS